MKRAEIDFPLTWEYRIIAQRTDEAFTAICEVMSAHGFDAKPQASAVSCNGAYVTYTVHMHITSREQMDALSQALGTCAGVKFLL